MILDAHDIGHLFVTTISDDPYIIILAAISYTYYYSFPYSWHIKEVV